jgi:tRNA1Val (adenine37-N6)-methyltransferase
MNNSILQHDEVLEDLGVKNLKIIQSRRLYRFTSDTVALANFARVRSGDTAADLGTGSAVIPLLLAGKTNVSYIAGIEIQSELADMAKRSVYLNNLQNKIDIFEIDIKQSLNSVKETLAKRLKKPGALFDVVTANPPYFPAVKTKTGNVLPLHNLSENGCGESQHGADASASIIGYEPFCNPLEKIRGEQPYDAAAAPSETNISDLIAKYETSAALGDFVSAASRLLRFGGSFYTVNKAARLAECFDLLHAEDLEPKNLALIFPKKGLPADAFLVRAVKGGRSGGLIVTIAD